MLAVFAVWAMFGFAFPSAPAPYALNVLSKILAFVVALSLFLSQRARPARQTRQRTPRPRSGKQVTGRCEIGKPRSAGEAITEAMDAVR